jgi:hypothetical protein
MANKRTKSAFGSKSAFVRNLPNLSAKEIVSQAAARGMTLSIGQVYNIRSVAKKRDEKGGSKTASAPISAVAKAPKAAPAARAQASSSSVGAEGQLRKLVAELGLSKARDILSQVEAAFRG